MSAVYSIRRAQPDDYDAMVRLWRQTGTHLRPAGRDARAPFVRQLAHFPGTYLVAECGNDIVGVLLGTHDTRKGWINRLAVHPDHRRHGVARALLAACERAFIDQGIEIFAALVEAENAASIAVFDRCNYRRDIPDSHHSRVEYLHKRLRPDV